jgi:hypothetical protein
MNAGIRTSDKIAQEDSYRGPGAAGAGFRMNGQLYAKGIAYFPLDAVGERMHLGKRAVIRESYMTSYLPMIAITVHMEMVDILYGRIKIPDDAADVFLERLREPFTKKFITGIPDYLIGGVQYQSRYGKPHGSINPPEVSPKQRAGNDQYRCNCVTAMMPAVGNERWSILGTACMDREPGNGFFQQGGNGKYNDCTGCKAGNFRMTEPCNGVAQEIDSNQTQ